MKGFGKHWVLFLSLFWLFVAYDVVMVEMGSDHPTQIPANSKLMVTPDSSKQQ